MYGTPSGQPAEPASPSIENAQIVERKPSRRACIGFLAGCGCLKCLDVDRDMERSLARARELRNA